MKFGTEEQKQKFLPEMATGECRAAFSLSEPEMGSDVQALKSTAKKLDDGNYEINGQKMWVTNGLRSTIVFTLVRTDPKADPPYKGMSCFICEKEPGVCGEHRRVRGLHRPAAAEEDGLQGRRVDRARLRRLPVPGGEHPRRRGRGPQPRLPADDGRARGRPRERRRPRRRHRPARARARPALLPGAQDVRQADRPAPGHPVQARRHGDADRGRAPAHAQGRAAEGRRARAPSSRPAWRSSSPPRPAASASRSPSASTAATATPRSTRSSACTATRRCCSSARARRRSRRWSSGAKLLQRNKI